METEFEVMDREQLRRVHKGFDDPLFLLSVKKRKEGLSVDCEVLGSTGDDVYLVSFLPSAGMTCTCPDFGLRGDRVYCKHCVFVLREVFRVVGRTSGKIVFNSRESFNFLTRNSSDTEDSRIRLVMMRWPYIRDFETEVPCWTRPKECARKDESSYECPICLESGATFACKSCRNHFHEECARRWVELGNRTCPLCVDRSFHMSFYH